MSTSSHRVPPRARRRVVTPGGRPAWRWRTLALALTAFVVTLATAVGAAVPVGAKSPGRSLPSVSLVDPAGSTASGGQVFVRVRLSNPTTAPATMSVSFDRTSITAGVRAIDAPPVVCLPRTGKAHPICGFVVPASSSIDVVYRLPAFETVPNRQQYTVTARSQHGFGTSMATVSDSMLFFRF